MVASCCSTPTIASCKGQHESQKGKLNLYCNGYLKKMQPVFYHFGTSGSKACCGGDLLFRGSPWEGGIEQERGGELQPPYKTFK